MAKTPNDANKINPIDLDASIDDIDDLPGFASFPSGGFLVTLVKGFEHKMINKSPTIEMAMTLKEVIECPEENLDEGENLPKEGDVATMLFQMDNAIGAGLFKQAAAPVKELGANTLREIIETSKGLDLMVVVKRKAGKGENEGRNFMSLVKVAVA